MRGDPIVGILERRESVVSEGVSLALLIQGLGFRVLLLTSQFPNIHINLEFVQPFPFGPQLRYSARPSCNPSFHVNLHVLFHPICHHSYVRTLNPKPQALKP